MIIKTRDFILRPSVLSDYKAYFEIHNDAEARKNFTSYPKNFADAKKEFKESLNTKDGEIFSVIVNKEIAGFVWLSHIIPKHKASVGFGLIQSFRGRGLGTKSLKVITDYAFKKYKLVRMYTTTRTFNMGARHILENAGYKLEGILKKNNMKKNVYRDDCMYGKVK